MQKALSVVTSICFLITTSTVWAVPQAGIEIMPQRETPAFLHVEIPERLATIEEIYEAPASAHPRLILHIQNAHGSYKAQQKIKELLEYLYKSYSFKLLFVEGAVEKLDPNYLRLFPDQERNLALADYLAQKGELTGAELYLMDAPPDVSAVGVEDPALYRANYEAFREVYRGMEESEEFLTAFERRLERLSSQYHSRDTRRLLQEWKRFEEGRREFLPYVKRLAADARKVLGLDLESLFAQVEWPQLTRLLVLQSMEKELDKEKAKKEQAQLVAFLKDKQIDPKIITAIESLEDKRIVMRRLSSEETRLDYLPRHLLEKLVEEAGPRGFHFHDYPAFSLYAGYLILQSELESQALFEEIESLFDKILNEVTVTELQKNLLELFRDSELLRKLLHLELTRKEWSRAFYRRDWIEPRAMVNRLMNLEAGGWEDGRTGQKTVLPVFEPFKKPRGASRAEKKKTKEEKWTRLTHNFQTAFRFYDLARRRESVFYQTIRDEMQKQKADKAVLVTGGFHTDGLLEIFREDKISYGVLMPRIEGQIDQSQYVSAMLENRPTFFDLATIEAILSLQSRSGRMSQGAREVQEVKSVLEAYARIGRFANLQELTEALNYFNTTQYSQDRRVRLEVVGNNAIRILFWAEETQQYFPLTDETSHILEIPIQVTTADDTGNPYYTLGDNVNISPETSTPLSELFPQTPGWDGASGLPPALGVAPPVSPPASTRVPGRPDVRVRIGNVLVTGGSLVPASDALQTPATGDTAQKVEEGPRFSLAELLKILGSEARLNNLSSSLSVALLAGGLFPLTGEASYDVRAEVRELAAYLSSTISTPPAMKALEELTKKEPFSDLLAATRDLPGALVIATNRVPTRAELRSVGAFLATRPNQIIVYAIVAENPEIVPQVEKDLEEARAEWEKVYGEAFKGRFLYEAGDVGRIVYSMNQLKFMGQKLPDILYERVRDTLEAEKTKAPGVGQLLQENVAILREPGADFMDRAVITVPVLESTFEASELVEDSSIAAAHVVVGALFSQLHKINPEKLKEITAASLRESEWHWDVWVTVPNNMRSFAHQAIRMLLQELEAITRTATSA